MSQPGSVDNGTSDESVAPAVPCEAFIREFTQAQRALYLYILPLVGSPSDADEVLQETNLVIWSKWHQFTTGTNFLAWARAIARFEILRFRRAGHRKVALLQEDILEQVARRAEFNSDHVEMRQQALAACMKKLRPRDRELIELRYAQGANGDSVAEQLGRPANSVYQSLSRIRRTLMECIQHRMAEARGAS